MQATGCWRLDAGQEASGRSQTSINDTGHAFPTSCYIADPVVPRPATAITILSGRPCRADLEHAWATDHPPVWLSHAAGLDADLRGGTACVVTATASRQLSPMCRPFSRSRWGRPANGAATDRVCRSPSSPQPPTPNPSPPPPPPRPPASTSSSPTPFLSPHASLHARRVWHNGGLCRDAAASTRAVLQLKGDHSGGVHCVF